MQLYLVRDKVKSGPFNHLQVKEMLAEGEVSAGDLGWHDELDNWMPLSEIPAVAMIIEEVEAEKTASTRTPARGTGGGDDTFDEELGCKQVRPFIRFFARSLDLAVYSTVVWIAVGGYPMPDLSVPPDELYIPPESARFAFIVQCVIYLSWTFIEAYLLAAYGTTLGKSLLRVEVRRGDGSRLDLRSSMKRAFYVLMIGFGLGLPFLREFAQLINLGRLLRDHITPWDRSLDLRVRHRPIGTERIVAYALILLTAAVAFGLASMSQAG